MKTNTRYIILLSVLTLTLLLSQIFLQNSISSSQKDSFIINISGRQRMLSQKITKHALQLRSHVKNPNWDYVVPELNQTLKDWEFGLHYLTEDEGASLTNPKVQELFSKAKPYFQEIHAATIAITQMHSVGKVDTLQAEELIERIQSNEENFLELMDEITYELDRISQEKISRLRTIEFILLSFTLLILALEVWGIYQPLSKKLQSKNEQNKNLTTIIDSLENYGVLYLDPDFKVIGGNKGASNLFQFTKEELIGKYLGFLFAEELAENFNQDKWVEMVKQRGMMQISGSHATKSGENFYAASTLLKVETAEGKLGYTLLTVDQSLYLKNRQLNEQNQQLTQFNYIASHDLKEPLRTIKGFLKLMETEYADDLNESYQTMMHHIVHSADRMENLITSLLSYAQTGANLQFVELDLNHLIKAVVSDLQKRMEEREVNFECEKLPKLVASSVEIRQLFQNLISNAIKYTPKNRKPNVKVRCTEEEQFFHFTIEDNGFGIEEKYLHEIFKPFKRLHGSEDTEGQGLGLAHCQKIVELHQGKIWVESIVNDGSRFHFTLSKKLTVNS